MIFKFLNLLEKIFEKSDIDISKYPDQYFIPKFENTLYYSNNVPKEIKDRMKMYYKLDLLQFKEKEIFDFNSVKFLEEMKISDYVSWLKLYSKNGGEIKDLKVSSESFNNINVEHRNLRDNKYLKAKRPFIITPLHGNRYKVIYMNSIAKNWPHDLGKNVILFSDGTISEGGEDRIEMFPKNVRML